jgi:hypothetical protein
MKRSVSGVGFAAFCYLISVGAVSAGVLTPSKASQLVTLWTALGTPGCGGGGNRYLINTQTLSDGTFAPFAVPPGQVLILKGGDVTVSWVGPGITAGAILNLSIGDASPTPVSDFDGVQLMSGGNPLARATLSFGDGVAIKSGKVPCYQLGGVNSPPTLNNLFLYGFLAPDK